MNGGSGAQSPIIQCFDAAFGSSHEPEKQAFLDNMREFMMPRHRAFIDALRQAPSISKYVKTSSNSELLAAYSQCLDTFRKYRTIHIQVAARFVIMMSRKWLDQDKREAISALGTGANGIYAKLSSNENHHNVVPSQYVLTDGWLY
ncbi:hypothetical protein NP493_1620g00025 [Ridgeia piscesae]|uniref:Indoleamine 2,3-dioxygenase n=1 Tax=Ridgeia piscesae TaxID=27915 RepID=A0AAD9NB95_RIDPI|nr:hypothetical protein NP493_1620g00025 [Ridgeia piscesae]